MGLFTLQEVFLALTGTTIFFFSLFLASFHNFSHVRFVVLHTLSVNHALMALYFVHSRATFAHHLISLLHAFLVVELKIFLNHLIFHHPFSQLLLQFFVILFHLAVYINLWTLKFLIGYADISPRHLLWKWHAISDRLSAQVWLQMVHVINARSTKMWFGSVLGCPNIVLVAGEASCRR